MPPLDKQPINISFSQGLDTKTDKFQVPVGKFLALNNTVFNKGGLLTKRNGYSALATLPTTTSNYLTTYNGSLTAVDSSLYAYNPGAANWVSKGHFHPLSLSTLPIIRNNSSQIQCDSVTAPNGSICTVYSESDGVTTTYKYTISDSATGQNIISATDIPVVSGVVTGSRKVFLLTSYFDIVFTNVITAVAGVSHVFQMDLTDVYTNNIYPMGYTITNRYMEYTDSIPTGPISYHSYYGNVGQVQIIRNDAARIIGRFHFQALDKLNGTVINVSQGWFNVRKF